MWRGALDPARVVGCYLPMLVVLAIGVLLMVLPVLAAPPATKITRYARKLVRGRPDASDDELRRILRARFLPDWATDKGPEANPMFGLAGMIAPMFHGMRSYLLVQVVESRINRAIEAADADRDD
jgi:hypothetical protein